MQVTRYTLALILLAAGPAVQAQEIPVYRWYNGSQNWHLYTTNATERPSGWAPEAVVFRVYAPGVSGTTPFYRLQRSDGGHFYTGNPTELSAVRARGWVVEGLLGHVATEPRSGAVALHRFLKPNGRHFYTTDRQEGVNAGFQHEGVIGYVPAGDNAAERERLAAEERARAEQEAARLAAEQEAARVAAAQEAARRAAEEEARTTAGTAAASGPFNIAITTATGMCVTPEADRPGAALYVRPCAEGGATFRIENGYAVTPGGHCISHSGWAAQKVVTLAACRDGRPDRTTQQWYFHANKLAQSASQSAVCLDVEGESRAAGARVIGYPCKDYNRPVENQRFSLGASFGAGLWTTRALPPEARRAVLTDGGAALFSNGTWVIAAGGNNVIAAGGNNVIAAGGNNVIAAGGNNLRIVQDPALLLQGARVIASGGNNVIASGALNLLPR